MMEIETHKQCVKYFTDLIFSRVDIDCWIAGGAVKSYFEKGYVSNNSDIDIFTTDRKRMCQIVLKLRKECDFKHYMITKNAIKGYGVINNKKYSIDVVKREFINMKDTIDQFDFTVCCFAVNKDKVEYHPSAPFDLLRKKIVINKITFPLSTMQRLQKYIKKGYTICNGGILNIAKSTQTIDFNNPEENHIEFYPDGSERFVRFD